MDIKSAKQKKVVRTVEQKLKRATRDVLQGALLESCLRLWRDFAARTDLSRTRKPETWAAALLYTFDRLQFGGWSQEDIAMLFGVSAISVSQKHRQMAETLDLVLLDARYLPEARRMAVRRDTSGGVTAAGNANQLLAPPFRVTSTGSPPPGAGSGLRWLGGARRERPPGSWKEP